MTIPLIGAFVRMLIFLLVSVFDWPIAVLLLGSLIDGICGMSCTMHMLCYTYLTDITALQQRSLRIALLSFISSIATIISEIGVGYCIKYLGYMWTFLIIISIIAVNFLYVILILQESIPVGQPLQVQCSRPTDTRSSLSLLWKPFVRMLNLYMKDDGSGIRWKLRFTCVSLTTSWSCSAGPGSDPHVIHACVSTVFFFRSDWLLLLLLKPRHSYFYFGSYQIVCCSDRRLGIDICWLSLWN